MAFKRARTDEQINERKKEIIIAAAKLFDRGGIDEVQFKAISEMTSFGRSSIYNYYKTKEEILLDLLSEEIIDWSFDIQDIIDTYDSLSKEQYCKLLAESFCKNPRLPKLLSILYSSLERNSSLEHLTEFKRQLFKYFVPFQESVSKYFGNSNYDDQYKFLFNSLVFISGLYPYTEMTEKQVKAMKAINQPIIETSLKEASYDGFIAFAHKL